jgi:hypothetical protein
VKKELDLVEAQNSAEMEFHVTESGRVYPERRPKADAERDHEKEEEEKSYHIARRSNDLCGG